jgi:hypothetical protein
MRLSLANNFESRDQALFAKGFVSNERVQRRLLRTAGTGNCEIMRERASLAVAWPAWSTLVVGLVPKISYWPLFGGMGIRIIDLVSNPEGTRSNGQPYPGKKSGINSTL